MKSVDINIKDGIRVLVYAVDNICFETTLFHYTIGHECMAFAVYQLGIKDSRYFGFRHVTNDLRVEWINLDYPLGQQLDINCKQHCLYLGVMYYISRAFIIDDEAALYQYFRQLHVDYLYSKYDCLPERAIKLASFYLRVILGPYDPEKHTIMSESCQNLFPVSIRMDERTSLYAQEKAFLNYKTLNIPSKTCMVLYIVEFESATYYGLECHSATLAETQESVHLMTSYNGIMLKYLLSPNTFLLKWSDILVIKRSRKCSIIIQQSSHSTQLDLPDRKRAKYFFQMAFLLMKFYQENPMFCDRSSKEPAKPEGYESYSVLLSNSQSETLRAVLSHQQSLTSIPDNVGSSPKTLYEAAEAAQSVLAQTSRQEQTALGATEAIASSLQVPFQETRTTDTKIESQPSTSAGAAEIRLNNGLVFNGSKARKYKAKKLNKGSQTLPCLNAMIDDRFQKYTETSPVHLLFQTLKNILQYLDEIENSERENQVANIETKPITKKDFSDLQPLQESGVRDKLHTIPHKSPLQETKSKNTNIDHTRPISTGQTVKKNTDTQMLKKSTDAVSPAKTEKNNQSDVADIQPISPRREYVHLEPATIETSPQSISKSELLALDESSKGAIHKHSKKPFVLKASNATQEIRNRDKYENLQRKLNEGHVFTEYRSAGVKNIQIPCSIGRHVDNLSRNRYQAVIPYDENRVQLSGRPDDIFGYINASSVKWRRGPFELNFIAAQAPLENTIEDFWQMVWEQKVSIVIMLNPIVNDGKLGCYQYWPLDWNPEQKLQCRSLTIIFHTYRRTPEYSLDILTITDTSGEQQLISNIHFTQWSRDDCPDDIPIFVGLLEEIESVQKLMRTKDPVQAPIVVMCHDGVGRTGVLIMSYIMKYCLMHNLEMNMPHLLGFLRANRMYMITSQKQYISVYEALICYLKGLFSRSKTYIVGPFKV